MMDLPEVSNLYSSLFTSLSREQVAGLFGSLGWGVRKCSWADYEVSCEWGELIIEAESPILIHGAVADVLANVDRVLQPLREAGVKYTAECYGEDGELLQEFEWRVDSMTFQEFLEKQAQQYHHKERRERREEWIAAVDRLMGQLRAWLAEADPARVLDVVPMEVERAEPSLGAYRVPSLKIGLGGTAVEVVPVGRNVLGMVGPQENGGFRAEGRVDITDGFRRYILYRTLNDGQEKWYALDERFQAAPLDRGRLEGILQDLLS